MAMWNLVLVVICAIIISSSKESDATTLPGTLSASGASAVAGGKACLAWPNGDQPYLTDYKTDTLSTLYTWSPFGPSSAKALGFDFVPMLFNAQEVNDFAKTVVKGYASTVLGFNEPNVQGQSQLSPQDAANLWRQYIEPLKNAGYRLGSPAMTTNPSDLSWMQEFNTACNGGCTIDFIALHWYGTSADNFKSYVENWHNTFGKPIWVTEFAYQNFNGGSQGNLPTIQSFMADVTSWMDEQDYVEKFCWFGAMLDLQNINPLDSLMNSDGSPSPLGVQFIHSG